MLRICGLESAVVDLQVLQSADLLHHCHSRHCLSITADAQQKIYNTALIKNLKHYIFNKYKLMKPTNIDFI